MDMGTNKATLNSLDIKSGTRQHHAKKSHWFVRLFPSIFTSVIAPLAVGLALQGYKGCDAPRATPPTVSHTVPSETPRPRQTTDTPFHR
jgi:hypothetical protein